MRRRVLHFPEFVGGSNDGYPVPKDAFDAPLTKAMERHALDLPAVYLDGDPTPRELKFDIETYYTRTMYCGGGEDVLRVKVLGSMPEASWMGQVWSRLLDTLTDISGRDNYIEFSDQFAQDIRRLGEGISDEALGQMVRQQLRRQERL